MRFQAKVAKIDLHLHTMKTATSIPLKYCTAIKTVLFIGGPQPCTTNPDGGLPPSSNQLIINCDIFTIIFD